MTYRSRTFCLAGALVGAFMFATQPVAAQEVSLRLHTLIPPPANPVKTFLVPWSKKVAEASKGRIKVTVYPAMQLGGTPQELDDQVEKGIVDIAWTLPGYSPNAYPKSEVFELPFINTNALATTLAIQDFYDMHLQDEYKAFHVLLLHCHDGSLFMAKGNPLTHVADFRGMKMRTATRVGGWYIKDLGGIAIGAPITELPQMLSKGIVNGTILPYEISPAVKMQDLVDNFTTLSGDQPRMDTVMFSFLMNKESYAKLSDANKKAIDGLAGRNIAHWAGQNWVDIEVPAKKVMMSKKKNRFNVISPEETKKFHAAAQGSYDRWISEMKEKGVDGAKLVADARSLVAKYTAQVKTEAKKMAK
jgi:TRAP-type transport system periplasmic protein